MRSATLSLSRSTSTPGLSVEYVKAANLRIPEIAFVHELLKAQRRTVGRLDGRFAGPTQDPLQKYADYDPQSAAISAAFTAAFQDYFHGDLKFGQGRTYRATNFSIGEQWKWTHKPIDAEGEQPIVNSGVDLAQALVQDANLKVLVLNGYYDLATPFSATEYMMAHLGAPPGNVGPYPDEVLRGGSHDVCTPTVAEEDEGGSGRLHRLNALGPIDQCIRGVVSAVYEAMAPQSITIRVPRYSGESS